MKTLIVYYSYTHNNELLAKDLQNRLDCDTLRIEEKSKRTGLTILLDLLFKRKPKIREHHVLLNEYSHIIFIAPIWAGKIAFPLSAFLLNERDKIHRYSFITLSGGRVGQKEKIVTALKKIVQKDPEKVTELWINDLLPEEKKNTVKYTTAYRIDKQDLEAFDKQISEFLKPAETEAQ